MSGYTPPAFWCLTRQAVARGHLAGASGPLTARSFQSLLFRKQAGAPGSGRPGHWAVGRESATRVSPASGPARAECDRALPGQRCPLSRRFVRLSRARTQESRAVITWTGRPGDTVRPRRKSPYAHPSRSDGLGSGEGEQGWIHPAHPVLPIRYPPGRRRLRSESPGRAASLPLGDSGEWSDLPCSPGQGTSCTLPGLDRARSTRSVPWEPRGSPSTREVLPHRRILLSVPRQWEDPPCLPRASLQG